MQKALILIIDASPETGSMYADYFRYHGYRAAEVEDVAEGIRLFPIPELQPNLVITELSEEPEWIEALHRLRWPEPGRETAVIACSSRLDPRWPVVPAGVDVDVALPKPASPRALLREAQRLLSRRPAYA